MSQNVEIVRQVIEANRSDVPEAEIVAALAHLHPSGEYTPARDAFESQTYRGERGFRRYLSDLADSWAQWRSEVEDVSEVGPDTVVAAFRFHATGKSSGAPIEAHLGLVFVLSQGKIMRGQAYSSPQEALEAVGLRE
jgi:ketosteroid isomerase-like protein